MDPSIEYDFNPYKLPPALLQAIGLVMAAASQTEAILTMGVGGCLGLDAEYAMATTAHMVVPLKISIALSAAEIRLNDLDAITFFRPFRPVCGRAATNPRQRERSAERSVENRT